MTISQTQFNDIVYYASLAHAAAKKGDNKGMFAGITLCEERYLSAVNNTSLSRDRIKGTLCLNCIYFADPRNQGETDYRDFCISQIAFEHKIIESLHSRHPETKAFTGPKTPYKHSLWRHFLDVHGMRTGLGLFIVIAAIILSSFVVPTNLLLGGVILIAGFIPYGAALVNMAPFLSRARDFLRIEKTYAPTLFYTADKNDTPNSDLNMDELDEEEREIMEEARRMPKKKTKVTVRPVLGGFFDKPFAEDDEEDKAPKNVQDTSGSNTNTPSGMK